MATKKLSRQRRVLTALEAQLKSGVKTLKDGITVVKLNDSDIIRINKEIQSLKQTISKKS